MQLTNNCVPLVYLKARTVRLFMPTHQCKKGSKEDFVLFHVEAVSISPQVENPVSRILVKPDVYHRHQASLDVPGSKVENRQYQLDLQGIGLYTGCWQEVLDKSKEPERPAALMTRSENPALEWNIASSQPPQWSHQGVILLPMIRKWDLQVVAAPAIALLHAQLEELVAGHSLEVSALTDIVLSASLDQLRLCSQLATETLLALQVLGLRDTLDRASPPPPSSTDSGVEMSSRIEVKPAAIVRQGEATAAQPFASVPFEIFVTGRAVVASFHSVKAYTSSDGRDPKDSSTWRRLKLRSFRRNPINPDNDNDLGYDASEEGSVADNVQTMEHLPTQVTPLLFVSVVQPHAFLTCSSSASQQRLELSMYDVNISLPTGNQVITCTAGRCLPTQEDFGRAFLQTRPGEPSRTSGIPPALFTLTAKEFLCPSSARIEARLERPLKMNISHLEEMRTALKTINETMWVDQIDQIDQIDQSPQASSSSWQILERFQSATLSTKQIVVAWLQHDNALQLGLYSLEAELCPKSEMVEFCLDAHKVIARCVEKRVRNYRLLGPFNLELRADSTRQPRIAMQLNADLINVFVGRQSHAVLTSILSAFPTDSSSSNLSSEGLFSDNGSMVPGISEQHYADDLRAGAFHFVEKEKMEASEAKPYQVVFTERPLAMTWRYPKPRAITRLSVFPLPFVSADTATQAHRVDCSLQFWDLALKSFQTYSEFALSETSVT